MTKEDLLQIQELLHAELTKELMPIRDRLDVVDQRLDGFEKRLDEVDKRLEVVDTRLNEVDKRLEVVDTRLSGIDERLDEIDERLDRLEESAEITRTAANELCKWAENVAIIPAVNVKFPPNAS